MILKILWMVITIMVKRKMTIWLWHWYLSEFWFTWQCGRYLTWKSKKKFIFNNVQWYPAQIIISGLFQYKDRNSCYNDKIVSSKSYLYTGNSITGKNGIEMELSDLYNDNYHTWRDRVYIEMMLCCLLAAHSLLIVMTVKLTWGVHLLIKMTNSAWRHLMINLSEWGHFQRHSEM